MPQATATLASTGTVLASSSTYETVEGNVYFPPAALEDSVTFKTTSTHTTCPWKGVASYYTIKDGDTEVKDAAWYYPAPYSKAENIKDYVAFYKTKVKVTVA